MQWDLLQNDSVSRAHIPDVSLQIIAPLCDTFVRPNRAVPECEGCLHQVLFTLSAVSYCSNGDRVANLSSLKSLLSRTTFLSDKLADIFWCFVAHNLWQPLRVTAEMVCNVGLCDPRDILVHHLHASQNTRQLAYLMYRCHPLCLHA